MIGLKLYLNKQVCANRTTINFKCGALDWPKEILLSMAIQIIWQGTTTGQRWRGETVGNWPVIVWDRPHISMRTALMACAPGKSTLPTVMLCTTSLTRRSGGGRKGIHDGKIGIKMRTCEKFTVDVPYWEKVKCVNIVVRCLSEKWRIVRFLPQKGASIPVFSRCGYSLGESRQCLSWAYWPKGATRWISTFLHTWYI